MPERVPGSVVIWGVAAVVVVLAVMRLVDARGEPSAGPVKLERRAARRVEPERAARRGCSSTWRGRSGGRACSGWPTGRGWPRRSRGPAAQTRRPTSTGVNLAARMQDGQQVVVPAAGRRRRHRRAGAGGRRGPRRRPSRAWAPRRVEQLEELDGIGPTLAERIVEYRQDAHGGFRSLERAARGGGDRREAPRVAARGAAAVRSGQRAGAARARARRRPGPVRAAGPGRVAVGRPRRLPRSVRPWHLAAGSVAAGLVLASAGGAAVVAAGGAVAPRRSRRSARRPPLGALCAALLLAGSRRGRRARLAAIDAPAARVRRRRARLAARAQLALAGRARPPSGPAPRSRHGGRLDGARLLLRIPRWARVPPGWRVGAELAVQRARCAPSRIRRRRAPGEASFDFAAYLRRRGVAGELLLDRRAATGAPGRARRPARPHAGAGGAGGRGRDAAGRGVARARHGPRPGRADRRGRARGLPRLRARPSAGGERPERDAARRARAAAAGGCRARAARARASRCSS